jgi:hypothetical protein
LASTAATQNTLFSSNVYFDGSTFRYIGSSTASYLQQFEGAFIWKTAPSGTAGDAISFTQAMTLDASGNLGIGTTSVVSGARVDIRGNNSNTLSDLSSQILTVIDNTSYAQNVGGGIGFGFKYSSANEVIQRAAIIKAVKENATDGNYASSLVFATAPNAANTVERARIDSSGNFGLGTTTPASFSGQTSLTINGTDNSRIDMYVGGASTAGLVASSTATFLETRTATPLVFNTNNTERARITSGGEFLVGTTSVVNLAKFCLVGDFYNGNGLTTQTTSSLGGDQFVGFVNSSGTVIGSINRVTTTNVVAYNTTSDYRLKTVIGSVSGSGARIDALKPVDYLWTEGGQQARGFLAHEFQTVYPNSVTGEKDAVDANGNPKYQAMQASTSEVIADLVAEIQSLRARLAAANI